MRTRFPQTLLGLLVLATACTNDAATGVAPDADGTVDSARAAALAVLPAEVAGMYRAHTDAVPAGKALRYDLLLHFNGTERFRGSVTQTPSMDRIAMQRSADGAELRWDGSQVALMASDTSAEWPRARFAAFTWPYFFAAPMKLADPGTRWAAPEAYPWADGQPARGAKLTFAPGTGDAPDDYYIVFANPEGLVDGMAYVVTFGKDSVDVESLEPHAIRYSDYRMVDGVPVAHHWSFHDWNAETGLGPETIGYADLSDLRWVEPTEEMFVTAGGEVVE